MITILIDIYRWAKADYRTWPLRFCFEILAWALSIGCSITMAATVPNPPLLVIYPIWITGCSIYCWAAWTRGSFGMVANYMLLASIDTFGFIHLLTKN